jgi:hypothetical protein
LFCSTTPGDGVELFVHFHLSPNKSCYPGLAQRDPGPIVPLAQWVPARRDASASLGRDDRYGWVAAGKEKPPLFSDGYGLGAIRELGEMYTATVTVVK